MQTQHCLVATVRDAFLNPVPDVTVRFAVTGVNTGHATHCYTGPDLPGEDAIHAYADNDGDATQDPDERAEDTAAKTRILPLSTPGCEIKLNTGGWIRTLTGSKGTFRRQRPDRAGRHDHERPARLPGPLHADSDHLPLRHGARRRLR